MTGAPVIPDQITVHLGHPDDASAPNVTVPFPDYIKNVASSEIYPTWPESALRANIYAQVSFALNRIYTEWYRSRGYDFDITNSTQFDQSYVPGRDYFENISKLVDDLFDDYLVRQNQIEPLLASYCNGTTTTCDGLSQWGSVALAEQGLGAYDILTRYYGTNLNIVEDAPVKAPVESYPGIPLRKGSVGNDVASLQIRLNRISSNYPAIPKIDPVNGIFDADTEEAVRAFQRIFGLTVDGIVGNATWYRIAYLYTSVKRLAELDSEGLTFQELPNQYPQLLREGDTGSGVQWIQYLLAVISRYMDQVPEPPQDGIFGPKTTASVKAFQQASGLVVDGLVGRNTWNALYNEYRGILKTVPESTLQGGVPLFPGAALVLGSTGSDVTLMQEYLARISETFSEIPAPPVTGTYDEATETSVRAFQRFYGLEDTGIIGAATWSAIGSLYSDLTKGGQVQPGQYPGFSLKEGGIV